METSNSTKSEELEIISHKFEKALLDTDKLAAHKILTELNKRWSSIQIAEKVIVSTMERIGLNWENGEVALSQVYMAGIICEEFIDSNILSTPPPLKDQAKIAITVLEDYHLLGKRIVSSVLRSGGFKIIDYGRKNVDELVERVKKDRVDILLVSTLMLRSALKIKDVKQNLKASGFDLKIVVGGAPFRFDQSLWKSVGADAMAKNASEVISIINGL